MPPRARLSKHTTAGADAAMEGAEIHGWERSNLTNQDKKSLKKLGLVQKDSLIFPGDESAPKPPMGYRLHQLTPNSILHISIFVTLCECFLGSHPHWGLWKRWHKKWLYIKDKTIGGQEYGIAPFASAAEILRRKSWDAEATAEEKAAIDALMKRIRQLQNTRGEELSGIQITAHFLRIRVQPLQARKTPLWAYTGGEDVDRLSEDLSTKDLEKLIRRFSSLSKKYEVPTSCRVEPYSGSHALPEGGEVDERTIINDESQESTPPETEVAGSHKSAASSDKVTESDASESVRSPPSAVSPKNKRKRSGTEDSGASKPTGHAADETSPEDGDAFDLYSDAGSVSS
ncbi:hypothetical protein QYE76_056247 [Lolium multiflorum]|uniref:Transposase (putative) gypsy type domain-containing protein n=1 Tax=Lolium multiflorum TaxID=4521 RepID=A0AAD8T2Y6_LOLMU|nr:hypothetical protein QYE76_056247 [Lolium multiflorum]